VAPGQKSEEKAEMMKQKKNWQSDDAEEYGYATENPYVIDPDLLEEMHRLDLQGQLFTRAMGTLLAERPDFSGIGHVLDLGCGPAEWVLSVAQEHPDIQVVGVDKAPRMIEFARARAAADRLSNAIFQIADVTAPLPFPDASFDLVNARFLQGFMQPAQWSALVGEGRRLLRPGGLLRLTEAEPWMTSSAAWERWTRILMQALFTAGRTFSPDGVHWGVVFMLRRFLEEVGLQQVQERAYAINFSSGTQAHEGICQDLLTSVRLVQPFVTSLLPEYPQETTEELREQMERDANTPGFCGLWFFLSAMGEKLQAGN
jgi:ubiquinone/menaquinone biosynthesis C-methylase UbiE